MEKNLALKKALCEKAEALKDSTDWKSTTEKMIALQKRMEDDRIGSPQTFRCRLEALHHGLRLFLRTEEQECIFPKERGANEFSC